MRRHLRDLFPSPLHSRVLRGWLAGSLLLLPLAGHAYYRGDASPLRAVIFGGGPNLEYNQVAIESNVRYVNRLLPSPVPRTTLFADGDPNNATVLYEIDPRKAPAADRVLRLLLRDKDSSEGNAAQYKKPNVGGRIDGSCRFNEVNRVFSKLADETARQPNKRLFLYFTGHGSSDQQGDENNIFDLWGNEKLTVRDLSKQIARLPAETPITLVMVQCHSGSFANLLFEGGDPRGEALSRNIAGFFAATKERPAAGCTSEVNEAEYRDFTSYFFAALTGKDRVGRKVTGADYNNDGRVSMDEAFYYTIANDRSIDVPVCTSDIFLRRYVPLKDAEVFKTRYSDVLQWASPAQRAALNALAKTLKRESGEDRLQIAYRDMTQGMFGGGGGGENLGEARREFLTARREGRARLLARFPALRNASSAGYASALEQAKALIAAEARAGEWRRLLSAEEALATSESAMERREVSESHLLRFVRLGKSVILAKRLRENGDPILTERFDMLLKSESASLLSDAPDPSREEARNE